MPDLVLAGVSAGGSTALVLGRAFTLSAVTRDQTGAILGGCQVHLFRTAGDVAVDVIQSDPTTGAFTHTVFDQALYYYTGVKQESGSSSVIRGSSAAVLGSSTKQLGALSRNDLRGS
jgi:hypothetical protein